MTNATGWYVLYVRSRHEKKVHDLLKELSIETFLPMFKTIKEWSDRKKILLKPLFPSYIFVNINSSTEFHKALSINGVCSYIRFGAEYAKITEKEIMQVKFLMGMKEVSEIEVNQLFPKIGEKRKILFGALKGLECEVLKISKKMKVIVRLETLKLNITAVVPIKFLSNNW